LQAGTSYKFRIAAVNQLGDGTFSDYVDLDFKGWSQSETEDKGNEVVVAVVIVAAMFVVLAISAMITYFLCRK